MLTNRLRESSHIKEFLRLVKNFHKANKKSFKELSDKRILTPAFRRLRFSDVVTLFWRNGRNGDSAGGGGSGSGGGR